MARIDPVQHHFPTSSLPRKPVAPPPRGLWKHQWSPDGRKNERRFVPATLCHDGFLLHNLEHDPWLYAADYAKLTPEENGKRPSRVFTKRKFDQDVGEMGNWQLVRADPTNRDVFALYNPQVQVAKCYVALGQIQNALAVLEGMLEPKTYPLVADVEGASAVVDRMMQASAGALR